MKKWFYVLALSALAFYGCKKDEGCNAPTPAITASAAEKTYLQNYLTANNITATEKNGMFYVISSQGTAASPNLCSKITVDYVGKLINGTTDGAQFDASQPNSPFISELKNLILGWQVVLPLVKAGGTVSLYIPPSLGYGSQASGPIPANSYLKFVITLKAVN